eukprot:scaffold207_cov267-Pinguiococcus_pyrenoidosus.AAC.31
MLQQVTSNFPFLDPTATKCRERCRGAKNPLGASCSSLATTSRAGLGSEPSSITLTRSTGAKRDERGGEILSRRLRKGYDHRFFSVGLKAARQRTLLVFDVQPARLPQPPCLRRC